MNIKSLNKTVRHLANRDSDLSDKGHHSKMHSRLFEGYEEYETTNARGKTVIKRVYVGEYYTLDLPKSRCIALHVLYGALFVLVVLLFSIAAGRNLTLNSKWYTVIAQLGALECLVWTFGGLLSLFAAPKNMTIGEWKNSSRNLRYGSFCTAVFLELNAVISLLGWLFAKEPAGYFTNTGLFFGAGLMALMLNHLEANAPYKHFPSENTVPQTPRPQGG